jgi:hypothetical protein
MDFNYIMLCIERKDPIIYFWVSRSIEVPVVGCRSAASCTTSVSSPTLCACAGLIHVWCNSILRHMLRRRQPTSYTRRTTDDVSCAPASISVERLDSVLQCLLSQSSGRKKERWYDQAINASIVVVNSWCSGTPPERAAGLAQLTGFVYGPHWIEKLKINHPSPPAPTSLVRWLAVPFRSKTRNKLASATT